MIVLDEQLLGRGLDTEIARWYRGAVQFIIDLRPHTVIKDDAIPEITDIPDGLRALFSHPEFKTKAGRMGKVVRITAEEISYYTFNDRQIRQLE